MTYGWCPGVFTPMQADDGFLVRVKPRLSRVDADTARAIAQAVREYGNGRIELTSRANLQVRGLTLQGAKCFARDMVACGVADADPEIERQRNIIVAPFAGKTTLEVSAALQQALARSDLMLPAKFGFALDCVDVPTDIFIYPNQGLCHIAGAQNSVLAGVDGALALARAFLHLGGTRRMCDLVAAIGEDAIYAASGLHQTSASPALPPAHAAHTIATPELNPDTLTDAADFARSHGDGLLRVSNRRALLIAGVQTHAAAA